MKKPFDRSFHQTTNPNLCQSFKRGIEMKRRSILLMMAMVLGLVTTVNAGIYSGGAGTAEDPYRISTVGDWEELTITAGDWDKPFVLTANG